MTTLSQIKTEVLNNVIILHLSGEVDVTNLQDLENFVSPLVSDNNNKSLIIDCKGLKFIDSKIVGYIASLYTFLSNSNRKIIISSVNETISDILTLVGLTNIIQSFASFKEAIDSLK